MVVAQTVMIRQPRLQTRMTKILQVIKTFARPKQLAAAVARSSGCDQRTKIVPPTGTSSAQANESNFKARGTCDAVMHVWPLPGSPAAAACFHPKLELWSTPGDPQATEARNMVQLTKPAHLTAL